MDYAEALKKVQTRKSKENYMVIELAYDNKIILPHKDGITFLTALIAAERLEEPYNKPHIITEFDRAKIVVTQMSNNEYERFKIAKLLNLTVAEVKENYTQD